MTASTDLTREEIAVSRREHPDVQHDILARAIELARDRGGQTIPVSTYDIQRAEDEASGFASEAAQLRAELAAVKAELAALRTRSNAGNRTMSEEEKKRAVFGDIVLDGMAEIERAEASLPDGCAPEEYSLTFDVPNRGSWIVSIKRERVS